MIRAPSGISVAGQPVRVAARRPSARGGAAPSRRPARRRGSRASGSRSAGGARARAAPARSAGPACAGSPPGSRACRGRAGCRRAGSARPRSSGSPSRAAIARRELGDALRVAAGVDVARVDGAREARRGAEARRAVGPAREPLQLGELDHVGPVGADAVLAVLLRPVERAVGEADQLVAVGAVLRERRDAGADGDRADLLELERARSARRSTPRGRAALRSS